MKWWNIDTYISYLFFLFLGHVGNRWFSLKEENEKIRTTEKKLKRNFKVIFRCSSLGEAQSKNALIYFDVGIILYIVMTIEQYFNWLWMSLYLYWQMYFILFYIRFIIKEKNTRF